MSLVLTLILAAAPPEVALLSTAPAADATELRFQRVGAADLAPVAARFTHLEGETVLGAVLPGRRVVLAAAPLAPARDVSFSASLVRLETGQPARVLVDRVAYSTRPLVTAEGRVFVQRGVAGRAPADLASPRVDALAVDEVDPDSGRARTIFAAEGSTTFLAGALGREVLVYVVAPAGARLVAVHADSLAVRTLLPSMEPLARDFVVDAPRKRLLFTQGDPQTRRWHVVELDLVTLASKTLASGATMALVPAVLPDGAVAYAPGAGHGLLVAGTKRVAVAAQGAGFERLRGAAGGVLVGLHELPSGFPAAFAVAVTDGAPLPLAAPPGTRLDVAGVLP